MTAISIRTEADKLAVETGILTDIRPIFYENDIKGSLILHNLKVNQSGWEPSFGKLTLSSGCAFCHDEQTTFDFLLKLL